VEYMCCVLQINTSSKNYSENEEEHEYNATYMNNSKKARSYVTKFDPSFYEKYPSRIDWRQKIRQQLQVPQLTGASPPQYPGIRKETPQWIKQAEKFAKYMMVLITPWNVDTTKPPFD